MLAQWINFSESNMSLAVRLFIIFSLVSHSLSLNVQGSVDGTPPTFDVAVLMPSSGNWTVGQSIGSAPIVALQRITSESVLPYSVNWEWKDTQCNPRVGTKVLMELWNAASDLDAIIGGGCSIVCKPVALIAASFNIPFVSFGCNDDSLSDKVTYPTFTRTVGPWGSLSTMLDKIFEYLHWTTRVGIVSSSDSLMVNTATTFKDVFESPSTSGHTQKMVEYRTLDRSGVITSRQLATYMKSRARIIIVLMYNADLRAFLLACRDEGMMNGGYAYITIDADLTVPRSETIRPEDVSTSYNGILNLHVTKPSGTAWDTFATGVVAGFADAKFTAHTTIGISANIEEVDVHAGMLHDAFLTWAYGVQSAHALNPSNLDNGEIITNQIIGGSAFSGISGQVEFDSNGNRKPDYTISIVQELANTPLFEYSEGTQTLTKVHRPNAAHDFGGLNWKGGLSGPPSSEPRCGWYQEHCPNKRIALKVTLSLLFVIAVFLGVGYMIYRRFMYMKDLKDVSSWKITARDMSDSRIHTQLMATRALLRARTKTTLTDGQEVLCNVATIRGKLCVVKALNRPSVNASDNAILLEMKTMREMKNPNINPFVAAVCDHPNVAICMQFAERGSLQDVLYNVDINLTWDFKLSLAVDIAKGISYIHSSPLVFHGHLTSSNCVVDSRWAGKITDYGATHFKKGHRKSDKQITQSKLWKAPEFLSNGHFGSEISQKSQSGDIYSFGIILQEILTRDRPFYLELEDMTVGDIIQRVSERLAPPFRPRIKPHLAETSPDWIQLMVLCWDDDPICRPRIKNVLQSLKDISGNRSFDMGEKMLTLMEDHSQHLEELLSTRNEELNVAKNRVHNLLVSLLPPSVADDLTHGRAVKAGVFDNVSICYVHILNMEYILANTKPQELTEKLNIICQHFDAAASKCDAFKIETAAFGALFVNGCPHAKEDHQAELVQLAAGLLMNVIDDESDCSLYLGIGVHTGSLVAGIVGITVPRYCLFGSMLQVAIRLAETAEHMMIHISHLIHKNIPHELYIIKEGPGMVIEDSFSKTYFVSDT